VYKFFFQKVLFRSKAVGALSDLSISYSNHELSTG